MEKIMRTKLLAVSAAAILLFCAQPAGSSDAPASYINVLENDYLLVSAPTVKDWSVLKLSGSGPGIGYARYASKLEGAFEDVPRGRDVWEAIGPEYPDILYFGNKKYDAFMLIDVMIMTPWKYAAPDAAITLKNYLSVGLNSEDMEDVAEPVQIYKEMNEGMAFYKVDVEVKKSGKRSDGSLFDKGPSKKDKGTSKVTSIVRYLLPCPEQNVLYIVSIVNPNKESAKDVSSFTDDIRKSILYKVAPTRSRGINEELVFISQLAASFREDTKEETERKEKDKKKERRKKEAKKGMSIIWSENGQADFIPFSEEEVEFVDKKKALEYFSAMRTRTEQALAKYPDSKELMLASAILSEFNPQGVRYGDGFDRAAAVTQYEKLLSVDPSNTDALFNLGVLCYRAGEKSKALEYVSRAAALLKVDPAMYYLAAKLSKELGRPDEALALYDKAFFSFSDFEKSVLKKKYDMVKKERETAYKAKGIKPDKKEIKSWRYKTNGFVDYSRPVNLNQAFPTTGFGLNAYQQNVMMAGDAYAVWYAMVGPLEFPPKKNVLTAKWYAPDGTLYKEDLEWLPGIDQNVDGQGLASVFVGADLAATNLVFLLPIKGTDAEKKTGLWKLEIHYKDELVQEKEFLLVK